MPPTRPPTPSVRPCWRAAPQRGLTLAAAPPPQQHDRPSATPKTLPALVPLRTLGRALAWARASGALLCAAASGVAARGAMGRRRVTGLRAAGGGSSSGLEEADPKEYRVISFALAVFIAVAAPSVAMAESTPSAATPAATVMTEPLEVEGTYLELLELVEDGSVSQVDLFDSGKTAVTEIKDDDGVEELVVSLPGTGTTPDFIEKLLKRSIKINVHAHEDELTTTEVMALIAIEFALPFFLTGTFLWVLQQSLSFRRRSKAEVQVTPRTGVTFEHVAGIGEAKEEVSEIVDFLQTPERFVRLGAQLPRGVMLTGPPGTGKTLLARALAGEAGVALIHTSGSDFVEGLVGVGAARVRDIFQKAREHSPCIVFIDEIDTIGSRRGTSPKAGRGSSEKDQTLNQLLTEMDGFKGSDGIIVVAATNRFDALDSAMLRPGRFDRHIAVGLPDLRGRQQILEVHAANKRLNSDVSLTAIAQQTAGFSGAQLGNLLNEAAILAVRRQRTQISSAEVDAALDRVTVGIQGTSLSDSATKRLVAYHEAGHALVGTLLPHHDHVHKVTLIPKGPEPSFTRFMLLEDQSLVSRRALQAQITSALAGRAAERLVFGERRVTSGARGDLQRVERLARAMVTQFGMSDVGALTLHDGGVTGPTYSEHLAGAIDRAIHQISDECFQAALAMLQEHRACLDRIVGELVEQETLTGAQLREIIAEFVEVPPRLSSA